MSDDRLWRMLQVIQMVLLTVATALLLYVLLRDVIL